MDYINLSSYDLDEFYKDLNELNLELTERQIEQFIVYYEMLVEKNKVMNLTGITDFKEVLKKHFIDSLSFVKSFSIADKDKISLIDIGTGAGFPGLPIKIAFPNIKVTLLDSLNKRIDFLNEVIDELGLDNIETIHSRAEDFIKIDNVRESYDLCCSRAVANLSVLLEYCIPYLKIGGKFISYKSEKVNDEILSAQSAIDILGCKLEKQFDFNLPNSTIYRNIVVFSKESNTPLKYPRKAGLPVKKPL